MAKDIAEIKSDAVEEILESFDLNGNLFNWAVEFNLVKDSNYQYEISSFMGEDIPEQAESIFENFWGGVCITLGNLTSVTGSEKFSKLLRKEINNQPFTDEILEGDVKIVYTKNTKDSEISWVRDGKAVLDFLSGLEYNSEEESAEREAISW